MDEEAKTTPEVIIANLQEHFGEWVVRNCHHKGDKGLLVQAQTGELFVVTVASVRGVVVT
jgi:hypothetical protein